jgi:hypothetical protein
LANVTDEDVEDELVDHFQSTVWDGSEANSTEVLGMKTNDLLKGSASFSNLQLQHAHHFQMYCL